MHDLDDLWEQLPALGDGDRARLLDELGARLLWDERHTEALAAVEAALDLYRALHEPGEVARCQHNAAAVLASSGRLGEAAARERQALAGYAEGGWLQEEAEAHRSLAKLLRGLGHHEEAITHLEAAVALNESCGAERDAAACRLALGEAHQRLGAVAVAEREYAAAQVAGA